MYDILQLNDMLLQELGDLADKLEIKEEYDNYATTMSEYRNISNVLSDVEMTSELKGHVRVKIKGKNVEYIE